MDSFREGVLCGVAYLLIAYGLVRLLPRLVAWRVVLPLWALFNAAAVYLVFYRAAPQGATWFAAYLAFVAICYLLLQRLRAARGLAGWLPFLVPIGMLVLCKSVEGLRFIGISYLAFRLSYLVFEVRTGRTTVSNFWEYLGFAFFLPVVFLGPITPYTWYAATLRQPDRVVTPPLTCVWRVFLGLVKFRLLGALLAPLTFSALWTDGYRHGPLDFAVSCVAYYLFLYCNFSGFSDLVIGASGLLGIKVKENFLHPLGARNLQVYWNRWHISLAEYLREVVFTPLSKWLTGRWGGARVAHAVAVAIFVTFVLLGLWHGFALNYLLWGALQGAGLVAVHYYTVFLKRRLGKRLKGYQENPLIRAAATALTFVFMSLSFFLFENNWAAMTAVVEAFRW